ncbi:MAG: ribosome silencing factor [Fidelibacterota bacterium]
MPESPSPPKSIPSEKLARDISRLALSKKAEDIHVLDVRQITTITDYFIVCSGSTDVHVKAIHDSILEGLEAEIKPWHVEGIDALRWVLMDYVDVVVHVFQPEVRDYYQLERLWADADMEILQDEPTETPKAGNAGR